MLTNSLIYLFIEGETVETSDRSILFILIVGSGV